MKLNIIIPVRNEEKLIEKTIANLENKVKTEHRIIVVDDSSGDATRTIVERIARDNKNINMALNKFNAGFAAALKTGFEAADVNSAVVPVVADFCDQAETIDEMYRLITAGDDIVCASRYTGEGRVIGGKFPKSLVSRLVSRFLHSLTGVPCTDWTNSFKMYRREILKNIDIQSRGFEVSVEIVLKALLAGYKLSEVSTVWRGRREGKSKFHLLKNGWKYLKWVIFALNNRAEFRKAAKKSF